VLSVYAAAGIPEISPGADLATIIGDALDGLLSDGDILAVTSKIVSKAEGRIVHAEDREQAITDETVRVVASRAHKNGVTRIVENRLGMVAAAAGVDSSNTAAGTVLLLPVDPDASARTLRLALESRFGIRLGVIVTDTLGRAWREGQTDIAIGASGVRLIDDLRGSLDSHGRALDVTTPAVGDEIAAAADLVKGKAGGLPVAVVRGLARLLDPDAPGARVLVRPAANDMFRQGSEEAWRDGYAAGRASVAADRERAATPEPATLPEPATSPELAAAPELVEGRPSRDSARSAIGRAAVEQFESMPRNTGVRKTGKPVAVSHEPEPTREWIVVIPVKGTADAKSRFGEVADRGALALAIALDTTTAALAARSVVGVIVVTSGSAATVFDDLDALVVVEDAPAGLTAAVASGIDLAAELGAPGRGVAVLLGDLPALTAEELDAALGLAAAHERATVADAEGTGTVLVTAADGATHSTAFGPGSSAAHVAAGYVPLELPIGSGLRNDVDTLEQLAALRPRLGARTTAALGL
jgi:coenzyme F420-0:L-glutamate ligase/coenzyme F420-1:gamma-L-glutamate ligase